MSKVLRETIPMRTGMSLPGLSADKAAGPSIDEIERKRIAIHRVLLIGFSLQLWSPPFFYREKDASVIIDNLEIPTML
jgi:hypothetical protein